MWQFIVGGVAMLGAVGGAFWVGDSSGYARRDAQAMKAELRLERAGRAADQRAVKASNEIAQALAARTTTIRETHRTIEREIPRAITPETDARFPLSVGFVRVHDAAAASVPLADVHDPAGRPDDAASTVAASEAARVIGWNYEAANDCAARLIGWQDWWRAQVRAQGPPT